MNRFVVLALTRDGQGDRGAATLLSGELVLRLAGVGAGVVGPRVANHQHVAAPAADYVPALCETQTQVSIKINIFSNSSIRQETF